MARIPWKDRNWFEKFFLPMSPEDQEEARAAFLARKQGKSLPYIPSRSNSRSNRPSNREDGSKFANEKDLAELKKLWGPPTSPQQAAIRPNTSRTSAPPPPGKTSTPLPAPLPSHTRGKAGTVPKPGKKYSHISSYAENIAPPPKPSAPRSLDYYRQAYTPAPPFPGLVPLIDLPAASTQPRPPARPAKKKSKPIAAPQAPQYPYPESSQAAGPPVWSPPDFTPQEPAYPDIPPFRRTAPPQESAYPAPSRSLDRWQPTSRFGQALDNLYMSGGEAINRLSQYPLDRRAFRVLSRQAERLHNRSPEIGGMYINEVANQLPEGSPAKQALLDAQAMRKANISKVASETELTDAQADTVLGMEDRSQRTFLEEVEKRKRDREAFQRFNDETAGLPPDDPQLTLALRRLGGALEDSSTVFGAIPQLNPSVVGAMISAKNSLEQQRLINAGQRDVAGIYTAAQRDRAADDALFSSQARGIPFSRSQYDRMMEGALPNEANYTAKMFRSALDEEAERKSGGFYFKQIAQLNGEISDLTRELARVQNSALANPSAISSLKSRILGLEEQRASLERMTYGSRSPYSFYPLDPSTPVYPTSTGGFRNSDSTSPIPKY